MDIQKIKELALANGFKLKEQASGNMDLNAYVYDFANAVEREAKAQAMPEGFALVEKSLLNDIHESCVACLEIVSDKSIYKSLLMTIRDEVAPLIEAQEPANEL